MLKFTQVLVMAGTVMLMNLHGVTGHANQLLAAEINKATVNQAVTANSDFAVDMYQQLAGENAGKNMFFSPYSISVALTMTAEGARKETAEEMGKVLRFPEAARQIGDEMQLLPWNMAMIHTGMKELHERFNPKAVDPQVRQQIEVLRKELAASEARKKKFESAQKWEKLYQQQQKSQKLAEQLTKLSEQVDQYELRVANALWGEKTYPFQQSYLETVNQFYGTGAAVPVDFIHNYEPVRKQINGWVEKQTNDRIKDLLPMDSLNEDTRLVLTNAVYFKGEWSIPFDARNTRDEEFQAAGGKVRVPMMRQNEMKGIRYGAFNADGSFFNTPDKVPCDRGNDATNYPRNGGFLMAELPYKGKELSMVVMVPQDAGGIGALEKNLSSANLRGWLGKLQSRDVNVQMPKFKLETSYQKMKDTLKAMGMVRAFTEPSKPQGAQFDGMCASQDPRLKLYITVVCHKAFVEVNEKGTEAAAATAVVMAVETAMPLTMPFTPTFRADRPFVFAIRDVQTGTILFLGRVMNPMG